MDVHTVSTVSKATVKVHFLPDDVTILAKIGESWLDVAARAGVYIPIGCLSGACHVCTIGIVGEIAGEISGEASKAGKSSDVSANLVEAEELILACLHTVPPGFERIEVNLLDDPTW